MRAYRAAFLVAFTESREALARSNEFSGMLPLHFSFETDAIARRIFSDEKMERGSNSERARERDLSHIGVKCSRLAKDEKYNFATIA